jgi:hypothetical protein
MGDPEIDAQEDENITHTAVVSQKPLPDTTNRIKIPIMNKQVFFIPLTTPGALGLCRSGKSCAYMHAKFVPNTTTLTPPKIIVYSHTFDPTFGFPGEGPAKIATYNINGAKEKLFQVLGAASRAKIDVLLIQETHYYKTTRYHVRALESTAKRAGWIAHHAQATISDPKAGVAVLVRADSQSVTVIDGSPPQRTERKTDRNRVPDRK